MIRKRKRYVRPKKLYEKSRIEEENKLVERYALKNKHEIWKVLAKVSYFRRRAKELAKASREEQEVLFAKLRALGLKTHTIADVLALTLEDILRRRLSTILAEKKLASTLWQARQLVVHKHVRIHGNVVNVPSYLVSLDEESAITVDVKNPSLRVDVPEHARESTIKQEDSRGVPKREQITQELLPEKAVEKAGEETHEQTQA